MGKYYLLDNRKRSLKRIQRLFYFAILSVLLLLATAFIPFYAKAQTNWTTLFQDDFEDGIADGWDFSDSEGQPLAAPWPIEEDDGSLVLSGSDHTWANINFGSQWTDYSLQVKVKLIMGGVHLNCRFGDIGRYFIAVSENGLSLHKHIWPDTVYDLASDDTPFGINTWYTVKIVCIQDNLQVYVDGQLRLEYSDPDFLSYGSIAFETLDNSHIHFDDVLVVGDPQANWTTLLQDDFEDGIADGWYFSDSEGQPLAAPWPVEEDNGSLVLSGSDHTWANIDLGSQWTDYSLQVKVKLIIGSVNLNCRVSDIGRYFINFSENGLSLGKQIWPDTFYDLGSDDTPFGINTWYTVKIVCIQNNLKVYVDGQLRLEYSDPDFLSYGSIAFETSENSHIHFDDVLVVGEPPPTGENPSPDIRANGLNSPVTALSGSPVSITVSLDSGGQAGLDADWWLVEVSPSGIYYFDLAAGSFVSGLSNTYSGPLFDLSQTQILLFPSLTIGTHTFYFGVDTNMNGSLDMDRLFYDNVVVNVMGNQAIGETTTAITRNYRYESTMGDWVTDIMRAYDPGIDFALVNSGGLRADIDAGPITFGEVFEALPFGNTLVVVELNGNEVRQVLEEGITGAHGVVQVSGLQFVFDYDAPVGSRIVSDVIDLSTGLPLDPSTSYYVAVNDFMANGGDGYDTLVAKPQTNTYVLVRDLVVDWIMANSPFTPPDPAVEQRITALGTPPS